MYIMHKYNQAVVGDEYFGADKPVGLKERMSTAIKTVHNLVAHAWSVIGRQLAMSVVPSTEKIQRRKWAAQ